MFLRQIFDPKLARDSDLIGCQGSGEALVVDPARDVDRYGQLPQPRALNAVDRIARVPAGQLETAEATQDPATV